MDKWEKAIREKAYPVLTEAEFVYLVGLFHMAKDEADREAEIERLTERCEAYKSQVLAGSIEIERLLAALAEIAALKGEDLHVADGCGFDNMAAMRASAALGNQQAISSVLSESPATDKT